MQQQNKDVQTENSVDVQRRNVTKGNSETVDEFKYGFPSSGLSSISYKWWENKSNSISRQQSETKGAKERKLPPEKVADDDANLPSVVGEMLESHTSTAEPDSEWTSSLSALRKKAADDGQQALKLGVYKGHGMTNLDRAKKMVLVQVFKSALPTEWGDLYYES